MPLPCAASLCESSPQEKGIYRLIRRFDQGIDAERFGENMKNIGIILIRLYCAACPRPIGNPASNAQPSFKFESKVDTSEVLATVGQTRVTVSQIQKLLNKQSPYVLSEYKKDPAALDKFIEGQIRICALG